MSAPNKLVSAWSEAAKQPGGWHPLQAFKTASQTRWMVDGVIPANSIVWVTGKPACGKTFAVLDMATCVSTGREWHGRACEQATVIYVAAEGGGDIHIRRAAAEMAAGVSGPLNIVQARPRLDEPEGLAEIMALLQFSTLDQWRQDSEPNGLKFEAVSRVIRDVGYDRSAAYLTQDELKKFDVQDRFYDLSERKASGDQLGRSEADELARLEASLQPWERDYDALVAWAEELAESRLPPVERAAYKHYGLIHPTAESRSKKVLLVIDTYSQTSADDVKASVSRYIKNLRELGDQVEKQGGTLSVIVIDHLTKSGESFMGSMAKQGDSDAMIEIERKGQLVVLTCPDKMKAAKPFDPIHLELVPYALEGYHDGQGRMLSSLVVRDGEKTHRLRKAAGATGETAAALLLGMLEEAGSCTRDELRAHFMAHEFNAEKKADSARRAFLRALEGLIDDEVVSEADNVISFALV